MARKPHRRTFSMLGEALLSVCDACRDIRVIARAG